MASPKTKTRTHANGNRASSLSYGVYTRLKTKIVNGELQPGTPLGEVSLAQTLGISRTPVREALQHLQKDGLVTIDRSRGARVSEVSIRDALEVYEIRELTEPHAAKLAASRLPPELAQRLQEKLEALTASAHKGDISKGWQEEFGLHELILEAAGNRTLCEMICELRSRTERAFAYKPERRHDVSRQEHIELIKAILDRDTNRAEQLMREHIVNAKTSLIQR